MGLCCSKCVSVGKPANSYFALLFIDDYLTPISYCRRQRHVDVYILKLGSLRESIIIHFDNMSHSIYTGIKKREKEPKPTYSPSDSTWNHWCLLVEICIYICMYVISNRIFYKKRCCSCGRRGEEGKEGGAYIAVFLQGLYNEGVRELCSRELTGRHDCCFYINCRSKFYCTLYLPLVVFLLSLNILSRASIDR